MSHFQFHDDVIEPGSWGIQIEGWWHIVGCDTQEMAAAEAAIIYESETGAEPPLGRMGMVDSEGVGSMWIATKTANGTFDVVREP